MKNKITSFLIVIISINSVVAQLIPFTQLSHSNDPITIDQGIGCWLSAINMYNENAFYRFYDLQEAFGSSGGSDTFMVTNLEFAQSAAEDNTMLTYFVGTIDRADYYIPGSGDFNLTIDLNQLTILKSGNHVCKSSDNGTLINIPIDPLTLSTDQIVYYSIQVASGNLDEHFFSMGGNFSGDQAYAYFNGSESCDLTGLDVSDTSQIDALTDTLHIIMNLYGVYNPSEIGPPSNDVCENAEMLTVGTSYGDNIVDFTTLNATQVGGGCNTGSAMPVSNEIWTQVVIPAEGHLVVETGPDVTTGNTSFVSGMDSWSGSCGSLTYMDCGLSNYSIHDFSSIVINGTPGETVYVRIFGNFVVPFSVSAYNPPEPANISCENAQELQVGATFDDQKVDTTFLWTNGDALWYSFIAPADGNVTVETGPDARGNFTANTSIAVWSGVCEGFNLTPIANDLNGADTYNFSKLELTDLVPGETYFLTIADWFQVFRSPFTVSVYNDTLTTEESNFDGFDYFPNPVQETFMFDSVNPVDEIVVYNILGHRVLNQKYNTTTLSGAVDMAGLANGIYILRITIEDRTKTIKVIKE